GRELGHRVAVLRVKEWSVRIAIVGTGIGGLTLAAALARQGVRARIFERSAGPAEPGAGIQLAPNATRLLHRLGLGGALAAVALSAEPDVVIWLGPECHLVRYPVSHSRLVNVVATEPADQPDVLRAYRDWHPAVRALLAGAGRLSRWPLYHAPPPGRLHAR